MAASTTRITYWSFEMSKRRLRPTIITFTFIVLSGLCTLSGAQSPIVDGLSEVRTGSVDKVDFEADLIVVDGRQYRLVEDQRDVLANMLGSSIDDYADNIRLQSVEPGGKIRYVVDLLSERLGHQPPELFILGFER